MCEPGRRLAVLARMLRSELEEQEGSQELQPPRAMVFANSAEVRVGAVEKTLTSV